jgi:proteic killer suppression protein
MGCVNRITLTYAVNAEGRETIIVEFADPKLGELCASDKKARRRWPEWERLKRRLASLRSANTLADMTGVPGHCHALTADRAGQFALDLWAAYRLIFEPADNPLPRLPDGGLDRSQVRRVRILEVVNYHGN